MPAITQILLALGSVLGGLALSAGMVWFFDLSIMDAEELAQFPDGWTILDVLTHACAVMMCVGGTRAIYVAVGRSLSGKKDTPPMA